MSVTVIVPVYNAERFLSRCIQSIINQTYKSIELILVDDGSTDGSSSVCNEYAQLDARVKVIEQRNSGPAAARNAGLHHATGDFVFFLDADDFVDPNAIAVLVSAYDRHKPDLVMGNFCKLEPSGAILPQPFPLGSSTAQPSSDAILLSPEDAFDYVRHFLKHPSNHLVSYCWGRLYKLSIISQHGLSFHEDMRLFEDFVFNTDYLRHTDLIAFVDQPLYTYVMHATHVSASMAIFDADSLLRDMAVFNKTATQFLQSKPTGMSAGYDAANDVAYALVHYLIIFLLRSCRQLTRHNRQQIHREVAKLVNASIVKDSLRSYTPTKGNSRLLPWLLRLRLTDLIMPVARHRAYQRYGKPEVA